MSWRRAPRAGAAVAGLLLGGVAAVAGCGVTPTHHLDANSVASQIAHQMVEQYQVPTPDVRCPPGVRVRTGQTFSCSVAIDGQHTTVDGTVTDDKGSFRVVPTAAFISVPKAVTALEDDITARTHEAATVDCGTHRVLIVAPGHMFTCQATQAGVKRLVTVTVKDVSGHVSFSLGPPASTPTTTPAGTPSS